ncbi:MAG TPA: hypothetical protein VLL54_12235 [Pyrinomonadaceae bacterium]|nr:hypothetical protein [Pyrinomonadaceae bacterium]
MPNRTANVLAALTFVGRHLLRRSANAYYWDRGRPRPQMSA